MVNEKYTKFANMKEGIRYSQPAMLVAMEEGITKIGSCYVKLKLSDGDSTIQANVFDKTIDSMHSNGIREGTVINVDMTYKEPYYNILYVTVNKDDTVSVNDFVRSVPLDPDKMLEEIMSIISGSCEPGNKEDQYL